MINSPDYRKHFCSFGSSVLCYQIAYIHVRTLTYTLVISNVLIIFSSADIPLGLSALGIYSLASVGNHMAAVFFILLATMVDSKWGYLLPVLFADVLGRTVSKGPTQG
jgi:hypothetical protein